MLGVLGIVVEVHQFVGIVLQVVKLPLIELIKVHQLVALGANPIVAWHHVDARVLVVVVVNTVPPICRYFTGKQRQERSSLHLRVNRARGGL